MGIPKRLLGLKVMKPTKNAQEEVVGRQPEDKERHINIYISLCSCVCECDMFFGLVSLPAKLVSTKIE